MKERISRRKLLATAAGSLSLAGCIQSTAKQSWENGDDYPDDEERNRDCEIRSSKSTSGTIESSPSKLGYEPFIYTLSGRSDMHGTNQHYNLTVTADGDIEIITTTVTDAANSIVTAESSTLDRPDGSDLVEEQKLAEGETYQETWQVPDGETYTVLFVPNGAVNGPITVEIDFGCSYYLPLEEYKERSEG